MSVLCWAGVVVITQWQHKSRVEGRKGFGSVVGFIFVCTSTLFFFGGFPRFYFLFCVFLVLLPLFAGFFSLPRVWEHKLSRSKDSDRHWTKERVDQGKRGLCFEDCNWVWERLKACENLVLIWISVIWSNYEFVEFCRRGLNYINYVHNWMWHCDH